MRLFLIGVLALPFVAMADQNEQKDPGLDEAAVKAAESASKYAESREQKIIQLQRELEKRIAEMETRNAGKEKLALDAFKKLTPELRTDCKWLIDRSAEFRNNVQLYKGALLKAADAYAALVPMYQRMATDEPVEVYQERYMEMSVYAKRLSEEMHGRAKVVDKLLEEIGPNVRFLESSLGWLDALDGFLLIYDPVAGKSEEVENYLQRLRTFTKAIEDAARSLGKFTDRLQGGGTPTPAPKPKPPISMKHLPADYALGEGFAEPNRRGGSDK